MNFRSFSDRALREVVAWIVEAGLAEAPIAELVEGTVRRLVAAGVPVYRMRIAFRVLHPLFDGIGIGWSEEAGAEVSFSSLAEDDGSPFRTSPFYFMLANAVMEMRRRVDRDDDVERFPILAELKQEGATDYFASLVAFGDAAPHPATHGGLACSWVTRRPEGFSEDDVAAIRWVMRPLALALRVAIKDQITRTALDTFHGPLVGKRILSGAIKRGAGERLSAALWYSDLRDSTALADALPVEEFLDLLNAYFDCAAGAVVEQGGEVLDIIGDAILAMFPAGRGGTAAAMLALGRSRRRPARASGLPPCEARGHPARRPSNSVSGCISARSCSATRARPSG